MTCYRDSADSARRGLHGIDTQVAKAEQAVAGKTAIKQNRFVRLAGLKGYVTNLTDPTPDFVIGAYHQLWSIKKFVRTASRYRTVRISTGKHELTAEDPLPADLRDALAMINRARLLRRDCTLIRAKSEPVWRRSRPRWRS